MGGGGVKLRATYTSIEERSMLLVTPVGGEIGGKESFPEEVFLELNTERGSQPVGRGGKSKCGYHLLEIFWKISGPLCNVHYLDQCTMSIHQMITDEWET